MNIKDVLSRAHVYFSTLNHPVSSHTFSKRVQVTPKQARYVLRTYFKDYIVPRKHINKVYIKPGYK